MNIEIKRVTDDAELERCVDIIRHAFFTVAQEFNLTQANCPTNGAFISVENLKEVKKQNVAMYSLTVNNNQVGFVAIEEAPDKVFYIEKLSVIPEYRHNGLGKKLVDFAFEYAKNNEGKKIGIAIIDNNKILKDWYAGYGFVETMLKEYSHLPFKVCFMEKTV
ncbi:MAG: GNAT family N-acetyltransferase [Ruminiclostridium sp.]